MRQNKGVNKFFPANKDYTKVMFVDDHIQELHYKNMNFLKIFDFAPANFKKNVRFSMRKRRRKTSISL